LLHTEYEACLNGSATVETLQAVCMGTNMSLGLNPVSVCITQVRIIGTHGLRVTHLTIKRVQWCPLQSVAISDIYK